ncbi:MAG: UbiA family prenyltransferase [Desulfomicrobium sp.]|nr:UbiA family prenyltransferase [Desulfomicrobium sp.]NLV97140.1 UbiA family prenyltransferase [Desulfovibrionales bacterium]
MQRFLALSRSSHSLIDIAMPCFVALLWLGHFPEWPVFGASLVAIISGYTAIYALNDLVGVKIDREKFIESGINAGYAVEASALRHPIAQDKLSFSWGLAWFGMWYCLTLIAAWWLNPLLVLIVLVASALEVVYCLLLQVTYWRILLSGLVKSAGPIAAVFVVVPKPSLAGLGLLLMWVISWEIGGQNIPADWNDVEEDRRVHGRTIPLVFGPKLAGIIVFTALLFTVVLGLFLPFFSPLYLGWPYQCLSMGAGIFLLLVPGFHLFKTGDGLQASRLFDRASFYPVAMLAIIMLFVFAQ